MDRDRSGARSVPAVERHPQQLPLQHDRWVAQHDRQDQRVPGRLMLHRDDTRAGVEHCRGPLNPPQSKPTTAFRRARTERAQNRPKPHHHLASAPAAAAARARRASTVRRKEASVERQRTQAFRPTDAFADLQMAPPSVFPRRRCPACELPALPARPPRRTRNQMQQPGCEKLVVFTRRWSVRR